MEMSLLFWLSGTRMSVVCGGRGFDEKDRASCIQYGSKEKKKGC